MTVLPRSHDVVISAVQFQPNEIQELTAAVRAADVPRFLDMGGAASLETEGAKLIDSAHFPLEYETEAQEAIPFLKVLKD